MRKPINPQMHLGEVDISAIHFDPCSRDDIPRILRGLQHLYINPELRQSVFLALEKIIPESIDKKNGRPGMDLWRVLVFGTLRLVINCDFDRLRELAAESQLPGWRQSEHTQKRYKKCYNKLRRLKHSTSSSETQRKAA